MKGNRLWLGLVAVPFVEVDAPVASEEALTLALSEAFKYSGYGSQNFGAET